MKKEKDKNEKDTKSKDELINEEYLKNEDNTKNEIGWKNEECLGNEDWGSTQNEDTITFVVLVLSPYECLAARFAKPAPDKASYFPVDEANKFQPSYPTPHLEYYTKGELK